jgi:Cys-tRNA(Pro)/Cys-tRNA(Cys) deacylase
MHGPPSTPAQRIPERPGDTGRLLERRASEEAALSEQPGEDGALRAVRALGLDHEVLRHGPVRSLAEAAAARGVEPADVVKTIVVRRGEGDYLFVLVPGDRTIAWPKLRSLLGVQRLSMPDAATALAVTGYERGTITPFGASTGWPVIADQRLLGRRVTLGAGAHGVAVAVDGDAAVAALDAQVADVTDPE